MRTRRPQWKGLLFVAPAALHLAIFAVTPMLLAAWLSLHRWHLLKPEHPFVGVGNYAELARDPFFLNAIKNTGVFVLLSVPAGVVSALLVALLVSGPGRGMGVFRTLYYIPAVSSQVAIAMVWIWLTLPEVGLINYLLGATGFSDQTDFLKVYPMACLVALNTWIGLGPRMVIFLAGLHAIPASLYESAALDGGSAWQRFRYVTLPMLAPTTFFVIVTSTIASFQIFTPVYIMTRGGPGRATDVVVYHIFKEAWQKLHVGMASAQTYVLFAAIVAVSLVQFALMRRRSEEMAQAW